MVRVGIFLNVEICKGRRPEFYIKLVPQLLLDLYKSCIDEDPLKRPTAELLKLKLFSMCEDAEIKPNNRSELIKQIRKSE